MASPTFTTLPALHCPEWAPKAVQTEHAALAESQKGIEAKRAEVLEALRKARNQDLAVYKPVAYDGRPMMQAELLHRRAVTVYLRSLMTASSAYKEKCHAEAERAREDVKKKLIGIGYLEPGDAPIRGAYTPEFVLRHPLVRCAEDKCNSNFDMGPSIRENQQQITDLEAKLSALREAVIS